MPLTELKIGELKVQLMIGRVASLLKQQRKEDFHTFERHAMQKLCWCTPQDDLPGCAIGASEFPLCLTLLLIEEPVNKHASHWVSRFAEVQQN